MSWSNNEGASKAFLWHKSFCGKQQVQGKVNAISLDSCTRTGLVFQDLVSSCEVVNCSSVEVQSTGVMPTIAIDKTDGITVGSTRTPTPVKVSVVLPAALLQEAVHLSATQLSSVTHRRQLT